jgi:hypothetical protein
MSGERRSIIKMIRFSIDESARVEARAMSVRSPVATYIRECALGTLASPLRAQWVDAVLGTVTSLWQALTALRLVAERSGDAGAQRLADQAIADVGRLLQTLREDPAIPRAEDTAS